MAQLILGNLARKSVGRCPIKFVCLFAALTSTCVCPALLDAQSYVGIDLYTLTVPTGLHGVSIDEYPSVASGGRVVGNALSPTFGTHALLYGPSGTVVDLHPTGLPIFDSSDATGTDGVHQVGVAYSSTLNTNHAMLWSGTAASAVDLQPTNLSRFVTSEALGTSGTQQVGDGFGIAANGTLFQHALLWNGTADSAVDLQPKNMGAYTESVAYGTNGTQQVGAGWGRHAKNAFPFHALLWNGTAQSAVDLNPKKLPGITGSTAFGTSGTQQVGIGLGEDTLGTYEHALLWSGTAASAVDLNPTNFSGIIFQGSEALGTNGVYQVGAGTATYPDGSFKFSHALLWSGTAARRSGEEPAGPGSSPGPTSFRPGGRDERDWKGEPSPTLLSLAAHQTARPRKSIVEEFCQSV
jgi:hypothetical protein